MTSLTPFFQLTSVVVSTLHVVSDELCPLNDHQTVTYILGHHVNEPQTCLRDSYLLLASVKELCCPILHGQKRLIA